MIVVEALTGDLVGVIATKVSTVNAAVVVVLTGLHHLNIPRSAFTKL